MSRPEQSAKLSGWKDIGKYLGKSEDTAQRWAKEFGLPVIRLGRRGPVLADPRELDRWLAARSAAPPEAQPSPSAQRTIPEVGPPIETDRSGATLSTQTRWPRLLPVRRLQLADHPGFVLISSSVYAAVPTAALLMEVGDEWSTYAPAVIRAVPWVFAGSLMALLLSYQLLSYLIRKHARYAPWMATAVLFSSAAATGVCCYALLSDHAIVQSRLNLGTGQFGYFKDLFYAWAIIAVFAFPPYHLVVSLDQAQKEKPPTDCRYVPLQPADLPAHLRPSWLFAMFIVVSVLTFASSWIFVAGLIPGKDHTRFLLFALLRVGLQLILLLLCYWWYEQQLRSGRRRQLS